MRESGSHGAKAYTTICLSLPVVVLCVTAGLCRHVPLAFVPFAGIRFIRLAARGRRTIGLWHALTTSHET